MTDHATESNTSDHGIAVIGLAGRYPGAATVGELWRIVEKATDCATEATESDEYDDRSRVPVCYPIDGPELFDAELFGIPAREAEMLDPQHRLLLETGWTALEDASIDPGRFDGRIGAFVGAGANGYLFGDPTEYARISRQIDPYTLLLANDRDFLATRLAFKLGLTGPCVAVQTACSTSLVAVHMAVQSLLNGECEVALAGGANIRVPHRAGYRWREGGILSRSGRCRPFTAQADGTVSGNGVGLVVLTTPEFARSRRCRVRAIIRGTAVNNDGSRRQAFTAPSPRGQAGAIAEALAVAGVPAETVALVETHGTGTAVGDRIELAALDRIYGDRAEDRPCTLGTLKANIGHLDAAAGIAGLTKAILAIEMSTLPAALGAEAAVIDRPGFRLLSESRPWPADGTPRRAAISAFGIGGTNAHVIVEQAPDPAGRERSAGLELLPVAAQSPVALAQICEELAGALTDRPDIDLAAVSRTLRIGRRELSWRRAVLASDPESAASLLRAPDPGFRVETSPRLVLDFPDAAGESEAVFDAQCAVLSLIRRSVRAPMGATGQGVGRYAAAVACGEWTVDEALTALRAGRTPASVESGPTGPAVTVVIGSDGGGHRGIAVRALAEMWVRGADIDWAAYDGPDLPTTIALPTYPFQRRRYWLHDRMPTAGLPGPAGSPRESAEGARDSTTGGDGSSASIDPAPTRQSVEAAIIEVLKDVLGIEAVDGAQNYLDLGGDSFGALEVCERLEREFGFLVDSTYLVESATLADAAEQATISMTGGSVVPTGDAAEPLDSARPLRRSEPTTMRLRSGAAGPPLVCVHAAGGSGVIYRELALRLSVPGTIHAITDHGSPGDISLTTEPESLRSTARRYLDHVRRLAPDAPRAFVGLSYGGNIAQQMAEIARADGERVVLLAMIDSYPPAAYPPVPPSDERLLRALPWVLELGLGIGRTTPDSTRPSVSGTDYRTTMEQVRDLLIHSGVTGPSFSIDEVRRMFGIWRRHLHTLHLQPQQLDPFRGRGLLLQATEPQPPILADLLSLDPSSQGVEWQRWITDLAVKQVPGSHYSILNPPHVDTAAALIDAELEKNL